MKNKYFRVVAFCLAFAMFSCSSGKKNINSPAPEPVNATPPSSPSQDVSTDLSNLVTSEGTLVPSFAKATTSYSDGLNTNVTSVTLTPTAEDASAVIKVNGTVVNTGTASAPIAVTFGTTSVSITVEKPDGSSQKLYTVVYSKTSNARLTSLSITPNVSFVPSFVGTILAPYLVKTDGPTANVTLTSAAEDSNDTVKIVTPGATYNSNTATFPIVLGDNNISVVVTSSGGATNTYLINVRRMSNNADVAIFDLTDQGTLQTISTPPVSYVFPNKIKFDSYMPGKVDFKVTAADPNVTDIKANGVTIISGTSYSLSSITQHYPLTNNVAVVVTAEDGTQKSYAFQFNKEPVVYLYATGPSKGALGGHAGADAKCVQNKPQSIDSNVCSTAKAIIGTDPTLGAGNHAVKDMPVTDLIPTDRPFVDASASLAVAADFNDFINAAPINTLSSAGVMPMTGVYWWAGTIPGGGYGSTSINCHAFTSSAINMSNMAFVGLSTDTSGLFSNTKKPCSNGTNYALCACW